MNNAQLLAALFGGVAEASYVSTSTSRGPYKPHQGDRERLRRRLKGFHTLHDHTQWPKGDGSGMVRECPVCDLGLNHEQAHRHSISSED